MCESCNISLIYTEMFDGYMCPQCEKEYSLEYVDCDFNRHSRKRI